MIDFLTREFLIFEGKAPMPVWVMLVLLLIGVAAFLMTRQSKEDKLYEEMRSYQSLMWRSYMNGHYTAGDYWKGEYHAAYRKLQDWRMRHGRTANADANRQPVGR